MSGRQWAVMLFTAVGAGIGVFLGADVALDNWADLNVPRLILGSLVSILASVVAFLSKSPQQ